MTDEQKHKIENLDRKEEHDLTPQQAEEAQGGADAFEIKDFSFGVENPTTIGSATGGAGAGKIKFNEFTIKKTTDKASPLFFKSCVSGTHFKEVKLAVRKASRDQFEFLTITMTDAIISSFNQGTSDGENPT